MLVPVGVKYEDLQRTGRTARDREEVKVDIKEKDSKQALPRTQTYSAKALKQKRQCRKYLWEERYEGVSYLGERRGTPQNHTLNVKRKLHCEAHPYLSWL